jgi:hypothetical protein
MADISIEGTLGFYSIMGITKPGTDWINSNVQGVVHGVAHSDQTGLTHEIANGAAREGLVVNVNGIPWRSE